MSDCEDYRNLWWGKGEFNSKAIWDEVTLPHKLAVGVTLEEYERRVEEFNIHSCWEWAEGNVVVYELPSEPHEICIGAITKEILRACRNTERTNAEIFSVGSTRTRAGGQGKEADDSFRPQKPLVDSPHGSDGFDCPWPNIVVEVAYSESIAHVKEKVKGYWLQPNRAHDAIVVKIDPVLQGVMPTRMKAWHYCVSDRVTRNKLPSKKKFEFGLQDGNQNALNIQPDTCVINIQLECLYHDLDPRIQIPQNIPNPIALDFHYVQ